MAMGLSFFGRGRERMGVSAGHVAAAALAGGLVGFVAGVIGQPVATVVPHSAYLVLLAAELVSGPKAGALAGASFGLTRGLAAVALARSRGPSAEIADVLPRARALAARGNLAVAALGGLALLGATVL